MMNSQSSLDIMTSNCCGLLPAYSFYGAPGSGKGTQGIMVAERESFLHLSAGDILRRKIAEGDPTALAVKELMIKGELIDDSLIQQLVHDELKQNMSEQSLRGVVLDGFPRNANQAKTLIPMLESINTCFVGMINLDVPENEIFQRLLNRALIEKRADDNEESIRNRIAEWRKNYDAMREFFSARYRFYNVDGTGTPAEVYDRIIKSMGYTCRKLNSIAAS